MSDKIAQGQTSAAAKGIQAKVSSGAEVYFHPGSATLLFVPDRDRVAFENEQNLLARLMEDVLSAKRNLEEVTEQVIEIGKTSKARAETMMEEALHRVNIACEALREVLKDLTPDVEEGKLLSAAQKTAGIGLMELIPLSKKGVAGFKKTYVRSDRISNHWRTYELNDKDKKSGGKNFLKKITYTTEPDANGHTEERTRREIDGAKLLKAVKDTRPKLKAAGEDIKFIDDIDLILGSWCAEMNKRLKSWLEPTNKEFTKSNDVDLSVAAQIMRFSAGAGCNGEWNPFQRQINGKVKGNASLALGEAKCEKKWHLPDKAGFEYCYPNRSGEQSSLGAFKFVITAGLSGSIGASVAIEAGVMADWSRKTADGYGIRGTHSRLKLGALPGENSRDISVKIPNADTSVELGVFAGIEIGANIAGSIEWKSPEEGKDFVKFALIKPGINAQAGGGANAAFHLTYINGKFRIFCKAALCWGVGAKGQIGLEINVKELWVFFECFTMMLRNVDYQKLEEEISPDAFSSLSVLPIIALSYGVQNTAQMYSEMARIIDEMPDYDMIYEGLLNTLASAEQRRNLMNSINANPDCLKFTSPETKGSIIAMLIDNNFIDRGDIRNDNLDFTTLNFYKIGFMKRRKQAIFNALKWVQSKKDYENVMQHLALETGGITGDWERNQSKVISFLAEGEYNWMGDFSTQYAQKLLWLYKRLPDGNDIDPTSPLISIPQKNMDEYLALLDEQESNHTMLA